MKNKVLLIAFLLLLLIPIKANAIGICPAKQLSKYTTEAYNVKSSYELFKTESEEARFRITFTNVSNNLKIRYNGRDYYGTKESKVAISTTFEPNKEYQFEVYSNDNMQICGNAFLVTKKVKTLDRVFEIVDTVNSKMAMLGDSVVGFFSGVVRRLFKNKKDIIEEEEE